jgi:hypothetical protein
MGAVTGQQLHDALLAVVERGDLSESDLALALLHTQSMPYHIVSNPDRSAMVALGMVVGMELVRRHGVLALDDEHLMGHDSLATPVSVMQMMGHRYGLHFAYVTRGMVEDHLGLEPGGLTDEQWLEIDDTYDEWVDAVTSLSEHLDPLLEQVGWRCGDDGEWVYQPAGRDAKEPADGQG